MALIMEKLTMILPLKCLKRYLIKVIQRLSELLEH